jgi:hypothetical protein
MTGGLVWMPGSVGPQGGAAAHTLSGIKRRKLDDLKPREPDVREILAGVAMPGVTTALSELALELPDHRELVEFIARELTRELPTLLHKQAADLIQENDRKLERLTRAAANMTVLLKKYEMVKHQLLEQRLCGNSEVRVANTNNSV